MPTVAVDWQHQQMVKAYKLTLFWAAKHGKMGIADPDQRSGELQKHLACRGAFWILELNKWHQWLKLWLFFFGCLQVWSTWILG